MDFIPNYDEYSSAEIIDAFIYVDDFDHRERAIDLFLRVAKLKQKSPFDLELKDVIKNPLSLADNPHTTLDDRYSPEALELKEKLVRLKQVIKQD